MKVGITALTMIVLAVASFKVSAELALSQHDPKIVAALKPYERPKVLVGTLDGKNSGQFHNLINSAFKEKVIENGAEIIESRRSKRLLKEMRIHELLSSGRAYRGRKAVDLLLLWDFTSQSVSGEYRDRASKINLMSKIDGDTAQGRCNYEAQVQGHAKVYRLPSMDLLDTIILKGDEEVDRVGRKSPCQSAKAEEEAWLAEAGKEAVEKARINFQSHFLPYGFVIGVKKEKQHTLVQINMGENHGLKKGARVEFKRPFFVKDAFNPRKQTLEFETKARGRVTNNVTQRTAWVKIAKSDSSVQFFEKDKVELVAKRGVGFKLPW
jgi:hypothetical protein